MESLLWIVVLVVALAVLAWSPWDQPSRWEARTPESRTPESRDVEVSTASAEVSPSRPVRVVAWAASAGQSRIHAVGQTEAAGLCGHPLRGRWVLSMLPPEVVGCHLCPACLAVANVMVVSPSRTLRDTTPAVLATAPSGRPAADGPRRAGGGALVAVTHVDTSTQKAVPGSPYLPGTGEHCTASRVAA